ncbi:MAG: hypothetical protein HN380_15385 [Victivallales bacterium]|nr:hypothetical protein [Victivallales bacterium]
MRSLHPRLALCVAWVVGIIGPAAFAARERADRAGIAELEAKVATMYMVSQLKLSSMQKEAMLTIRKQIVPAAAKYLQRRQAWRKTTAKAVGDFVEYSTRTGEFPPDRIQKGLWHFDGEWLAMKRDFRTAVGPIVDGSGASLTPKQVERLKELAKDHWKIVGANYVFTGCASESETDSELTDVQRAGAVSQRVKVGTLSRVGYLCTAPYLEEALGVKNADFPHWWDMKEEVVQGKRLSTSGKLTFLIGINLKPEQLAEIAGSMRKNLPRAGRVACYGEDLSTGEAKSYVKALKSAAKTLGRGRAFSPEEMEDLRYDRCAWLDNQGKRKATPEGNIKCRKAREKIYETVCETLTESQVTRMVATKDCPIPTQAVKGISRAGQVASDKVAKVGKIIDAARQRDDWGTADCDYWWKKQVVTLSGGQGKQARMCADEKATAQARATDVVERARDMSAAEYLAKREDMCEGLLDLNLGEAHFLGVQEEAATPEGRQKLMDQKIRGFFIYGGPNLLPLIDARLAHAGNGKSKKRRR